MSTVTIPGKLVNKANHYRIRRDADGREWIGPSKKAQAYQEEVAWQVHLQEHREWRNRTPLQLTIRLIGQPHDIDGIKGILDGIEQSGRIMNDRQFRHIRIDHIDHAVPSVELEIAPLSLQKKVTAQIGKKKACISSQEKNNAEK